MRVAMARKCYWSNPLMSCGETNVHIIMYILQLAETLVNASSDG